MSDHVHWRLELEVQSGKDELNNLTAELVSASEAEPGTLVYEVSMSSDGKTCHFYERFADSAAALAHLGGFQANFAEQFMQVFKPVRIVVYGSPNAQVKEALAAFGPEYMKSVAGFAR